MRISDWSSDVCSSDLQIEGPQAKEADQLAVTYASFVQHAWDRGIGRFRNFMGYDQLWMEKVGSEDSCGRSLWAVGATANRARRSEERRVGKGGGRTCRSRWSPSY